MKIVNIEEEILHIFWSQIDPTRFRVKWISEKKQWLYLKAWAISNVNECLFGLAVGALIFGSSQLL